MLGFDDFFNNILQMIYQIGITAGLILVVLGVVQAFFWKLAFYVNLIVGLAITAFVTYLVSTVSELANKIIPLSVNPTLIVFVLLLVITLIAALLGPILALLEGFVWTCLGILIMSFMNTGSFYQSIVIGVVGGAVLVGVAAFAGSYVESSILSSLSRRRRGIRRPGSSNDRQPPEPQLVEPPRRDTREKLTTSTTNRVEYVRAPNGSSCSICKIQIEPQIVARCPSCGNYFHDGCMQAWIDLNGEACPSCGRQLIPR